jgi:hypothetical protein
MRARFASINRNTLSIATMLVLGVVLVGNAYLTASSKVEFSSWKAVLVQTDQNGPVSRAILAQVEAPSTERQLAARN